MKKNKHKGNLGIEKKGGKKIFFIFFSLQLLFLFFLWVQPFSIDFNSTNSVKFRFFIINEYEKIEKGDYVFFVPPIPPQLMDFVDRDAPFKKFVKRVVGVGGDEIRNTSTSIFVDNKEYKRESFIYRPDYPKRIPRDYFFLVSDNDNGLDSRYIGLVHVNAMKGAAHPLF